LGELLDICDDDLSQKKPEIIIISKNGEIYDEN